jgi:hypothetical protein
MKRLERWVHGDRAHRLTAQLTNYAIVLTEEKDLTYLNGEAIQQKKSFQLSREDAEWLRWAIDELLKAS